MSVMSIRIDDKQRKLLKVIAFVEGKTMGGIVSELIEKYIKKKQSALVKKAKNEQTYGLMSLSEAAFNQWDNSEDEVYDNL